MRHTFEVDCTVEVEHSDDRVEAHVTLPDHFITRPGDRVTLLGPPLAVEFGQRQVVRRRARIVRAGPLRRLWTRLTGRLELSELVEVSF